MSSEEGVDICNLGEKTADVEVGKCETSRFFTSRDRIHLAGRGMGQKLDGIPFAKFR